MTNSQAGPIAVSKTATKALAPLSTLAPSSSPTTPLHKHVQRTHLHFVSPFSPAHTRQKDFKLTILNPNTILHQNSTLFSSVLPLTHLLRCTMTMGICSIIAKKP